MTCCDRDVAPTVPLSTLVRSLIDRVGNSTSAQLGLLREARRALDDAIAKTESECAPTTIAHRPVAGERRPREEPPPIPPRVRRCVSATAGAARLPLGTVTRIAGQIGVVELVDGHGGTSGGFQDGPALEARFDVPTVVAKFDDGALAIADAENARIRILRNGTVTTLAGDGFDEPLRDGPGSSARFNNLINISTDARGRLLVVDAGNRRIRRVTARGKTATIGGVNGPEIPGNMITAAVEARDGTIFVASFPPARVLTLSPDGTTTPFAGGDVQGFADGRGDQAKFHALHDMAIGPDGCLYAADCANRVVRRIDRSSNVTTIAGKPGIKSHFDGNIEDACFEGPLSLTIASDGTIYVGDDYRRVREIRDGVVSTLHTSLVEVNGLFLDESAGLLYVCVDHAIMTITVMTRAERREARYYPALRTWALVQEDRARALATPADASAEEARARGALRQLMRCPIPDILVRTLGFAFN